MDKIELRVADLNFTSTDEHELVVEGIVNDGNWSQTLGMRRKFKEKIQKGAFARAITRALQNNGKIDFLSEHDPNKVLSSTVNDSLKLWEDENKGLCMRAVICPTSWGKDTFQLIKSGIIKSMSFGFNVIEDEWINTRSEVANRIVKDLHLIEVSAVRNPAYLSSVISARGMELVEDIENIESVGEQDGEVQVKENRESEEVVETTQVNEEVEADQMVEQVKDNSTNVENDIQTMMKKMLEQFENILSTYVRKPQDTSIEENSSTIQEEPIQESTEETVEKDGQALKEEVVAVVNDEAVEQQEVVNDEVVEETVDKSQIDYAIELLSKYKKIQELQK